MSPRAKTQNYINLQLADREVRARDPHAWAILLDHDGNIAEGLGSNIFFVRDGELLTPDKGTSSLAQGPIAHTCLVEVERFEGEPPTVTAFEPPEIVWPSNRA